MMSGGLEGVRFPPGKTRKDCEDLYENFLCMFGEAIDGDIILTVLESKNWDVELAAEDLMKLQLDFEESKSKQQRPKSISPLNEYKQVVSDFLMSFNNASSNNNTDSEMGAASAVQPSAYSYNQNWVNNIDLTEAIISDYPENKRMSEREENKTNIHANVRIKEEVVDEDDDDDADVIIEEEKEFEIKDEDHLNSLSFSLQPQFNLLSISSQPRQACSNFLLNNSTHLQSSSKSNEFNLVKSNRSRETNVTVREPSITKSQNVFLMNYKQAKKIKDDFNRIYALAVNGVKVLVLLRGCPGSGKSFTASLLLKNINESGALPNKLNDVCHIFSTDDFFYTRHGYNFDFNKLPEAHEWNRKRIEKAAQNQISPIIVDNTNTQSWEMRPYAMIGVLNGYVIEVLEPNTKWKYNDNDLFKRNVHSVPKHRIRNMLDRFEMNITGDKLLQILNITYASNMKPPQPLPSMNLDGDLKENTKKKRTKSRSNKKKAVENTKENLTDFLFSMKNMSTDQRQSFSDNRDQIISHENILNPLKSSNSPISEVEDSATSLVTRDDVNDEFQKLLSDYSEFSKESACSKLCMKPDLFLTNYNLAKTIKNDFERILMLIMSEVKVVVLLRGCPGSGKTYSANKLISEINNSSQFVNNVEYNNHVFSVDDYFISDGNFIFVRNELSEAYLWNQSKAKFVMENNISPVIIDNCNAESLEMKPYVEMATMYGYDIEILEPNTTWKFDVKELTKRNIHSTSRIKIQYMLDRYERDISSDKLLDLFNFSYPVDKKPPQIADNNICVTDLLQKNELFRRPAELIAIKNNEEIFGDNRILNEGELILNEPGIIKENIEMPESLKSIPSFSAEELLTNDVIQEREGNNVSINKSSDKIPVLIHERAVINKQTAIDCIKSDEFIDENILVPDVAKVESPMKFCSIYHTIINEHKSTFDRIMILILCEVKVLVLMRGHHGSGKTHLAYNIIDKLNNLRKNNPELNHIDHVFNTDNKVISVFDYYKDKFGSPSFKIHKVVEAMKYNLNPVIVDNCNIELSEMRPYVEFAVTNGYVIEIFETNSDCNFDDSDENKSKLKMYRRGINGRMLIQLFKLQYGPEAIPRIDVKKYISALEIMSCSYHPEEYENSDKSFDTVIESDKFVSKNEIKTEENFEMANCENQTTSIEDKKSFTISEIFDDIDISPIPVNLCKEFVLVNKNSSTNENLQLNHELDNNNDERATDDSVAPNVIQVKDCETKDNTDNSEESSSEFYSSDKQNESFVSCQESLSNETTLFFDPENNSNIITADKTLEKINVIEWLIEEKNKTDSDNINLNKGNNEKDIKNCNNNNVPEYEFTDSWKSWDETTESSSKPNNTDKDNSPKPARTCEKVTNRDPSNNLLMNSEVKSNKVRKEFLGWSSVTDPYSDWFGKVKDTISGTTSSSELASKSPRNPRSDLDKESHVKSSDDESNAPNLLPNEMEHNSHSVISQDTLTSLPTIENLGDIVTLLRNTPSSSDNKLITNNEEVAENVDDIDNSNDENGDVGVKSNECTNQNNCDVLSNMFPNVASVYLNDLLEKCGGDMNWAAEILLEENHEVDNNYYQSENVIINNDNKQSSSDVNINKVSMSDPSIEGTKDTKKSSSKTKKFIKGNSNELKQLIEQNIILNASNYSENILSLIKKRRGDNSTDIQRTEGISDNQRFNLVNINESPTETAVVGIRDEEENAVGFTDNVDLNEQVDGMLLTEDDIDDDDDDDGEEEEEEERLQCIFSKDFISTLNSNFGGSALPLNILEDQCVVELPKSLARQIHYYVMDSVQQKLEEEERIMKRMISEDEEFARLLQEEENGNKSQHKRSNTPDLQEIIDMETALAIYKSDIENKSEKKESNESFAARLGQSILLEKFPNLDRKALLDLFRSNNNSLHNTIATLILNENGDTNLNEWEMNLLEQAKLESKKNNNLVDEEDDDVNVWRDDNHMRQQALTDLEYYRLEAEKHMKERADCFNKAKEAYNQGNKSVAAYYSQLAKLHMQQLEQANNKAATALLSAHSASSEITLDLHFYKVKEALEVLDLFLDSTINRLREKQTSKVILFVITGHGVHSTNRKAKLRPVIMSKLKSRKIPFSFVNPGMLRISVTKTTALSNST